MPFKKGQSGNPSGRPKKTPDILEIEALAKTMAPDAMTALRHWAKQRKNPQASVVAAKAIIDRGFGTARQTIDATITDERMVVRAPEKPADTADWVGKHGPH